jgi:hypothetical protein
MIMINLQLLGVIVPKKIKVNLKINIPLKNLNLNIFQINSKIQEKNSLKNMTVLKINILIGKIQTLIVQIHQVIYKIKKRKLVLLWYKILKKYLLQNELKKDQDTILLNKKKEGVNLKIIMHFLKNL